MLSSMDRIGVPVEVAALRVRVHVAKGDADNIAGEARALLRTSDGAASGGGRLGRRLAGTAQVCGRGGGSSVMLYVVAPITRRLTS